MTPKIKKKMEALAKEYILKHSADMPLTSKFDYEEGFKAASEIYEPLLNEAMEALGNAHDLTQTQIYQTLTKIKTELGDGKDE